jgi:hypothetical protein
VEGFCGVLFGSVFVLLDQLWTLPLWFLIGLTVLLSLLGSSILAVCLMMYDQGNVNNDF